RQERQIRRVRAAEGCGSQSPDDQDHLPPTHVPIVTGKPRMPMSFRQGGVPSCIRLRERLEGPGIPASVGRISEAEIVHRFGGVGWTIELKRRKEQHEKAV